MQAQSSDIYALEELLREILEELKKLNESVHKSDE